MKDRITRQPKQFFSEGVQHTMNTMLVEDRQDVSVQMGFICLLHLANENNYELFQQQNYEDILVKSQLPRVPGLM
jgi:chromatin segregation and condensation protein Rec8/ScpA/Scc1 (kleisin family)